MPRLFSSSSSPARARSIQQQKEQEESRRRSNFAFMKYKSERRTPTSMIRSREHAKQIAMRMEQSPSQQQQEEEDFVDFTPFPVTGTSMEKTSSSNVDSAYNMNAIDSSYSSRKTRRRPEQQQQSLDAFVQQQQHVSSPTNAASVASESTFSRYERSQSRTAGNSMPTFPSNSTMQSRNVSTTSTTSSSSGGGAARRRMARAQKLKSSSLVAKSDVGIDYDSFTNDNEASSPYPLTRAGSSQKQNHLLHYANTTPRGPIDAATPSSRSINSSSQGSSSQDAFGFSFDAFGLDETQVDLEVNEALTSLVQGSRPDLGFFLGEQEEFPMHNFDSSRGSTPTSEVDGFTDGFRLVNVKQSPTSSERSSLTSGTNEYQQSQQGGVNRFKVQAGFHKSSSSANRKGRPPVSPSVPTPQQYAKSEPGGQYMRTESSPEPFPMIPSLLNEQFGSPNQNHKEFSDPEPSIVFDDEDEGFDYGPKSSGIQYRSAKSEVTTSTNRPTTPTITYSDAGGGARSDVGVSSDAGARSDVGVNSDVGAKSDVAIASDVGVASDGGANSDIGQVPTDIMGRLRKDKQKSAAKRAQQAEEEEARRVSDLKHAWERRHQEEADEAAERLKRRQSARSPLPHAAMARLENQLGDELLSPEILEKKQVRGTTVSMLKSVKRSSGGTNRAAECTEQRTSFASYKERLKPTHSRTDENKKDYGSSKSDVGGYGRPSSELNAVLNRFNKQKSLGDSPRDSFGESRSEAGSSPSFLSNVKLRSTGRTVEHDKRPMQNGTQFEDSQSSFEAGPSQFDETFDDSNEFEDGFNYGGVQYVDGEGSYYSEDELECMRQQEEDEFGTDSSDDEPKPPKTMTYRERRKLELKAERERKHAEEAAKKEPERDVAALIRKRIAANKKAAVQAEKDKSKSTENISSMRNRLRKVSLEDKESPRQPSSAANKFVASSPDQPPSAAQKFLQSSPEFSVKQLKKTPPVPAEESPVQASSAVKRPDLEVETKENWPVTSESTSPNTRAPSMASTEVDSSSTTRTFEELPSSVNQKRQPTTEVPAERATPSESVRHEPAQPTPQQEEERSEGSSPPAATGIVEQESISASSATAKNALTALLGKRIAPPMLPSPGPKTPEPEPPKPQASELEPAKESKEDVSSALMKMHFQQDARRLEEETTPPKDAASGGRPALKDDPKYARYFRMLKMGLPMDVVKHAMTRDDLDPSVMDGDHKKPAGGVPLKDDPKFARYFRMLAMGLPMGAVKNAMERDGVDPAIMDGDHNLPAGAGLSGDEEAVEEDRPKDTHRRTRLHWETLRQVRASSLWAKIDNDPEVDNIDIDEDEFAELFQAELTPVQQTTKGLAGSSGKRKGAAVRVIESKRANNGGIILARLKMTHDEMADVVDRIDENAMTAEQMEHIIEYLPTKEERKALEAYMLEGDQDAAEKFDGLCECEKFMVAMMTVKHAKRKVRALLFKLQFESCLESLEHDVDMVESACDELKNSVRLRKLLGIVLNIGNRLNTAGASGKRKAGAFSLNSLLKLSQAKAFDKKTTFLQYVVLVVQRNNEILLNFKDDIPTALKADKVYWDQCLSDLEDVENQLENVRRMALYQARLAQTYRLQKKSKGDDDDESLSDASMTLEEEVESLRSSAIGLFTLSAIKKVSTLRDKVESTKVKFSKLLEYFGEEHRRDMQPHDLFTVFSTFSRDFDKAKEKVLADAKKKKREERKRQAAMTGSPNSVSQKASTPPGKSTLPTRAASSPDVLTSPKSDAGVRYNYTNVLPSESAGQEPQTQRKQTASTTMQQHSSTMNGMYETPKELARKNRPASGGSSRDRDAALRQKARRRRAQQLRASSTNTGEEGRPPRSAEKGQSPRTNVRKQRREEQRGSRAEESEQH